MNDTSREIVGFACRWCLLGAAMVGAALAAGVASSATASMASRAPAMACTDVLAGPAEWVVARWYLSPGRASDRPQPLLGVLPDGTACLTYSTTPDGIYVRSPRPTDDFCLLVRGLPYDALAFARQRVDARRALVTDRVLLVDSRVFEREAARDQAGVWKALDAMGRHGIAVVVVLPAEGEDASALVAADVARLRQTLRPQGNRALLLAAPWLSQPSAVIDSVRQQAGGKAQFALFTDDARLATAMAPTMSVSLISAAPLPTAPGVQRLPSLSAFADQASTRLAAVVR